MNKIPISVIILLIFGLLLSACCYDDVTSGGKVELYLLESFETLDHTCQIDETTVVTNEHPLLRYSDLLSYNSSEYIFQLSDRGKEAILEQDYPVTGMTFAVSAGGELIYTGYFWPGYSSASCQWVVTDPTHLYESNEMKIQLGYPGHFDGVSIPDERNDPRILKIFGMDNKLIK